MTAGCWIAVGMNHNRKEEKADKCGWQKKQQQQQEILNDIVLFWFTCILNSFLIPNLSHKLPIAI